MSAPNKFIYVGGSRQQVSLHWADWAADTIESLQSKNAALEAELQALRLEYMTYMNQATDQY